MKHLEHILWRAAKDILRVKHKSCRMESVKKLEWKFGSDYKEQKESIWARQRVRRQEF
jgi:hypothetical protein